MAKLILEDGREFKGKSLGAKNKSFGEIVFNTGMTGYQEILTDPSYAGQIITLTYPEIGNYGCNAEDYESRGSFAKGLVIKNYSPVVSNFRADQSLDEFLKKHNITAIYDLDTRALTKHIRDAGAMRAVIDPEEGESASLLDEVRASEDMTGLDLASRVTCEHKYLAEHSDCLFDEVPPVRKALNGKKIIALDFGVKQNILNCLIDQGLQVEVVPASTSIDYILEQDPDGVFLSNGPGDPAAVTYAVETVAQLIARYKKPIFGICLGHQILALAAGAQSFKLKFGHRGSNQPIKNLETSKIEIASHNHGFAISKEGLPENMEITHLNINDDTVAGIKIKRPEGFADIFSVQYHPEASPGPHDSWYLFEDFAKSL